MNQKRIYLSFLILFSSAIILLLYLWINYPQFPLAMKVWRGQYNSGFEISSFQPCGTQESWWVRVIGNTEKIYSIIPITHEIKPEVNTVYIEFVGRVSFKGNYGHLGVYEREIYIKDIYLVQREIPEDCH